MKRTYLIIAGILLVMATTVMATEKPNILFIAVDDLNDWEGFMGNNQIITPNMDALASQGTFFKSAHCQYAVCGPSRASVMSGMYYHSLGFGTESALQQKDDAVYDAVKEKGSSLIYEYFADHGYKTMAAGKLLHHHVPEETVDVSHGRGSWDFNLDENGNKKRLNWFGSKGLLDWGPISKPENEMSDYKAAEWAVDQLSQDHDKPFFLMTGFLRPHTPLYIQQKYLDMYPLDEIELPPYKADDYDDIPKAAESVWNSYPSTSWAIENNQWRKMLQAYMGCITFTDAQIGKILEALENSAYKDNTIIVLWSDHGFHMGEKDRFQKHTAWDRSTKVPMIIMDPRIGSTQGPTDPVEANVELIDIYPTLLELCGLPKNKAVEGRSLVPLIENPDLEWEYPAYTFRRETYATVKYDTYRFIEYFDGSRELYNHANDPNEWNNLAGDDAYKDLIETMYGLLQEPDVVLGYEESKQRIDADNTLKVLPQLEDRLGVSVSPWASDPVKKPSVVKVQKWRSSRWIDYQTITVDHLKEYEEKPVKICKYGGRLDSQEKATGFFYTKKVNGAWTLVDPCGHHYISMSVNSISPNDRNPDSKAAFKKKFGSKKNWAVKTAALLKEKLHLNSLGCWSSWELFKEAGTPIPYFRRWNVMAGYANEKNLTYKKYGHTGFENDVIPVFDPEFAVFCDTLFQNMKETKDDPYLIGHFSDNELPLKEKDIIKRYLKSGDKSPSAQRAKAWLKERGKTEDDISSKDDREFCKLVLSTYYRIVNEKMKKYDPNHLNVGTRIHGGVLNASVTYEACGPYVDVVSMNYYHRWSPEQDLLDERARLSGKPLLVTEWYAKGVDGGLPLEAGAGFAVHTQKERGMFYENYTLGLLKNKNVLGWHWHRYIDDGPKHRKENASNKGFLDTQFNEWEDLTNSVQRINKQVYSLRDYLLKLDSDNFPDKPRQAK